MPRTTDKWRGGAAQRVSGGMVCDRRPTWRRRSADVRTVFWNRLVVQFSEGAGPASPGVQAAAPEVLCSYSDDKESLSDLRFQLAAAARIQRTQGPVGYRGSLKGSGNTVWIAP